MSRKFRAIASMVVSLTLAYGFLPQASQGWAQGPPGGFPITPNDLDCTECVELDELEANSVDSSKIIDGAISEADLAFDPATQAEHDAHAADPNAHHAPTVDTTLDQAGIEGFGFVTGPHTVDTDTSAATECASGEILVGGPDGCMDLRPRYVFVTIGTFTGDLATAGGGVDGLDGADNLCQQEAQAGVEPMPERAAQHQFVAWLSTEFVNARDRIDLIAGPYVKPNGEPVAFSSFDLLDRNLTTPIDVHADRTAVIGEHQVWTGSNAGGALIQGNPALTCGGWTSSSSSDRGRVGTTNFNNIHLGWSSTGSPTCDNLRRLYCFEVF